MNPKILIPFLVAFAVAGGMVIGHSIPPKADKAASAALPSGRCANAEGDSIPCRWGQTDCGLHCKRAKCHAGGGRWVYEEKPECLMQYGGIPEVVFGWPSCGSCEGGR